MSTNLPSELVDLLNRVGCSKRRLARASLSSCLVNDLGVRGDDLDDFASLLQSCLNVDMSGFQSSIYSPSEGELLFPASLGRWFRRSNKNYKKLPLVIVVTAMKSKKWTV